MDHLSGGAFGKIHIEKGHMVAAIFPADKWLVASSKCNYLTPHLVRLCHLTSFVH